MSNDCLSYVPPQTSGAWASLLPQVEQGVEAEVARRLELAGADPSRWPRAARDECSRLEKKLGAAQQLHATLHAELAAGEKQRQADAVARAAAGARAPLLENP